MPAQKTNLSIKQRLLILPILVVLIFHAGSLFQEGLGYLYSQQTIGFLNFWHQETLSKEWNGRIQPANFTKAVEGAERALRYSADNPVFTLQLARIFDRQAVHDEASAQDSLNIYRDLMMLRPAWPYYRADFAVAKARAGEFDAEFELALKEAMRLGPWEKDVLDKVARLGWLYRPGLNPSLQQQVDMNLARYVSAYPWDVIRWGEQEGHLPQLCLLFTELARLGSCRRYLIR